MNAKPACVAEVPIRPAAVELTPARRVPSRDSRRDARLGTGDSGLRTLIYFVGLLSCCLACGAQNPPAAESPAPAAEVVIPLIQFQDIPLTTAIENLARQAGLNHIMDPKVPYGQPDPATGKITPQPMINIRWENRTAEQALSALLTVYNLQLVDDPKTKISRITIKDPAAKEPLLTRVIQLKFASITNLMSAVQSSLTDPRSKVVGDQRTSQLVILATEKELTSVDDLVGKLDLPTKQVLIEAKILETTMNPKTVKGVDWTGTLNRQNITFGNGTTRGTTVTTSPGTPTSSSDPGGTSFSTTPGSSSQTTLNTLLGNGGVSFNTLRGFSPQTAFLDADGLSVALSFLNSSAETKVISEPRTVTLDNQKATIDVGLMFPIVNVQAGTANTAGGSSITYSNLTVNLDVTPRITANNFVELDVQQAVLRLGPKFTSTVGGVANAVDSFFTRKIKTSVLIPSGNTLVMGGLVSDEHNTANTKVPLLGDVPVLGWAFRHGSKERNQQNLIVFITPTIVQDNDFHPTATQFLKTRPTQFQSEINTASPWDSAKPHDWSNPKATPYEEAVFDESAVAPKNAPAKP